MQQVLVPHKKKGEVEPYLTLGMVNLLCRNVRGMNAPNKHKEVKILCNKVKAGIVGFVETKIQKNRIEKIADRLFGGWHYITNLESHYNGRLWLTWRQHYYSVVPISINTQNSDL